MLQEQVAGDALDGWALDEVAEAADALTEMELEEYNAMARDELDEARAARATFTETEADDDDLGDLGVRWVYKDIIDTVDFGERWMYEDLRDHLEDAIRNGQLPVTEMMTDHERFKLKRLPDVLTVYRGTWHDRQPGASWTLSRRIAKGFWDDAVDTLITGRVNKADVIALKLGRGEHEIISLRVWEVGRERLKSRGT